MARSEARSGVQSLDRAFDLLELLAAAGGELGLSELAASSSLPLPTIHRLMRTLVNRGYARQLPSRRYALGPGLIHLGDVAGKMLGAWARPHLQRLVDVTGETANLAILDGDEVVYVGQVPSRHAMRMFTEVGRRFLPHSTGVGKALLAQLADDEASALVSRTGLPAQTDRTITDQAVLRRELGRIRTRGYATDDGEQEPGVRCVAVPLVGAPTLAAVSVSGPVSRLTPAADDTVVPLLQQTAAALVASLVED
ncbi:MAG TPA: IclR family transcriptional regulator [Mycobacteriales bacterium]|nr:IclR family transcriptional regulator [Mycobacteriales bacterium]